MFRDLLSKVARRTPGLRRVADRVRGKTPSDAPAGEHSSAPQSPGFGATSPTAAPAAAPKAKPAATAPEKAVAAAAPKKAAAAKKPAAPKKAAAPKKKAAAPKKKAAAPKKKAAASRKKAAAPKRAAAPKKAAAPKRAAAPTEHKKSQAEIEALRAEAELKKAEIRARKQQQAASSKPALTGIAAMIAQSGGNVEDMNVDSGVSATSGIDWSPKDTAVHTADDGETFWGAIDNESSRSLARGDTLIIDQWECINCGTCVENTEHVFVLPEDAKAVVVAQEGPMDLIQDAIDACPVTCIHWTEEPSQFEQINDAKGADLT